jgi:hypothetical protein
MTEQERILREDVTLMGRCAWRPCDQLGDQMVMLTQGLRNHLKADKQRASLMVGGHNIGFVKNANQTPNAVRLCQAHFEEAGRLGVLADDDPYRPRTKSSG